MRQAFSRLSCNPIPLTQFHPSKFTPKFTHIRPRASKMASNPPKSTNEQTKDHPPSHLLAKILVAQSTPVCKKMLGDTPPPLMTNVGPTCVETIRLDISELS